MASTHTLEEPVRTFVPAVLSRGDYRIIEELVEEGSRVLDLGCGEGELLGWLEDRKGVEVRGVEISAAKVSKCVARGLSVYQGNIDQGLADYPDQCFDYVILSRTIQETHRPLTVLREMVRVGRRVIVAFPNFGHWSVRLSLLTTGRAPVTRHLPYTWYDSPNIHFVTVLDFEDLISREGLTIERCFFLRGDQRIHVLPTLRADLAVYLLRR